MIILIIKVYFITFLIIILISTTISVLRTDTSFQMHEGYRCLIIDTIQLVLDVIFLIDVIVRLLSSPDFSHFVKTPLNILDMSLRLVLSFVS